MTHQRNPRRRAPVSLSLAAALLGACVGVAAAEGVAVGVISEYSPTDARYALKRSGDASGATVPVRIGTVVMVGDEIVLPATGAVTVSVADGAPRRINGPGTFRMPAGAELGVARRVLQAVTAIFDVEYRSAVTAVSRGGAAACEPSAVPLPILVPILREQARIVSGIRDLPLAWSGGCPPYAVILSVGTTIVERRDNIPRSQIRLDGIALAAGTTYTVAISDSRGARRAIDVAAMAMAPTPPADLVRDASGMGMIARALWLADQDNGTWRLDSFEMLRPAIRRGEPMAGRIGDVLLWQNAVRLLDSAK